MDTKICTKCGKELPLTDFHWRNKAKGIKRSECKYCHNDYMNQKNAQNREIVHNLKQNSCCAKCGENRWYVLDYHHLNPEEKEATIARLTSNKYKLEDIQKEVNKCIVLCANCHREFHHFEKQNNLTIFEYLNSPVV